MSYIFLFLNFVAKICKAKKMNAENENKKN